MRRDDARRFAGEILLGLTQSPPHAAAAEPLAYKLLARLLADARRLGVVFESYAVGPWHVGQTAFRGVGRLIGERLPTAECGGFALPVPDFRQALELVGFLNWCEVPEPQLG
ncbi:MAG TPA: hypothetical protein VFU46_11580 [Gemmatimonadales bacterium]|nr:hypothetical protein [Gemmatimonadales bacterium]